jgi:streptogramin lyase
MRAATVRGVLVAFGSLIWCGASAAAPSPLGTITEYPIPMSGAGMTHIPESIAVGPDGNLWFADGGAATVQGPAGPAVGVVNPATHAITEYPVPPPPMFGSSDIRTLTAGPGGDLWFINDDGIGSINSSTHATAEYPLTADPSTYTGPIPFGIGAGPGGSLWFTAENGVGAEVGMLSPATQAFSVFPVPRPPDYTLPNVPAIVAGPGGNMWFAVDGTSGAIGTLNVSTHKLTEYGIRKSRGAGPRGAFGIANGPDGNVWFSTNRAIGVIDVATHRIATYPIPMTGGNSRPAPLSIATGPGGTLWFTDLHGSIGIIDPATHAIAEQPIPGSGHSPAYVTAGPDHNMWFTDSGTVGEVGVVTVPHQRPQLSRLRVHSRRSRAGRRAVLVTVSYRLTLPAGVTFTIIRFGPRRGPGKVLASASHTSGAGTNSFTVGLSGRSPANSASVLTATPLGGAGAGETHTVALILPRHR